jgi:hypothetical protein
MSRRLNPSAKAATVAIGLALAGLALQPLLAKAWGTAINGGSCWGTARSDLIPTASDYWGWGETVHNDNDCDSVYLESWGQRASGSWWYACVPGDWHPDRETCFMDDDMQSVGSYHNICEAFAPYECSGIIYTWEILP